MTTTLAERSLADDATGHVGDRAFKGLSTGAGLVILVALAGVALFLVQQGWPALTATGDQAYGKDNIVLFVWPLLFGTLLAAVLSILIAAGV